VALLPVIQQTRPTQSRVLGASRSSRGGSTYALSVRSHGTGMWIQFTSREAPATIPLASSMHLELARRLNRVAETEKPPKQAPSVTGRDTQLGY
jgi:hypothetical protein